MRLLSLAAGTILDVQPAEAVTVAATAGFPAVGIWYDHATWNARVAAGVRSRLDDTGMVALDVEPIMLSEAGDHGDVIVDAAIEVGARNILVASRDGDHVRVASRLEALARRLAGTDIRLVLEFLPVLAVRSLPEALAIVHAVDHPAVGVLVDALHLSRAGHVPGDLRGIDPHLLPYLQLCDAPAAPVDRTIATLLHEALHGRLLPGDGDLPLAELLVTVPNVPVSLELRSDALRTAYPDPVHRARAVLAATQQVLLSTS